MYFLQFSDFGVKWGFWTITLVPDMLGQSSSFQWLIGLVSTASQSWSKIQKHPTL